MDVWHRITFNKIENVGTLLDSLNIKYKKSLLPKGNYIIYLDIYESDPSWPIVNALNGFDWYNSVFTNDEILESELVRLIPAFERGYPQPKNYKTFMENTYELRCPRCGAGNQQKASIRLAKEPYLGKHHFMSTIWNAGLFCTHEVLNQLQTHDITGYQVWPVFINPKKEKSQILSQILFTNVAQPALADVDKMNPEKCPVCGTTHYDPLKRGFMHLKREALVNNIDCQLTYEWFAGAIFREYLISPRFAKLIIDNKWNGVALKPVKLF
jgi:hypothetical protein